MAGNLNNPRKFTIDDAFEEGYDDAVRVYGSTTERSPLKPKEKVTNTEDNVTVWVENPSEQRLSNVADDATSRDSDSLIRYNGYYSEYEYDPSEPCWKHPKIQENWKMVLAAAALLIIGICLFMIGIILATTSGIQGIVFFIAGFICFIPGAYHVVYIYFAVKGGTADVSGRRSDRGGRESGGEKVDGVDKSRRKRVTERRHSRRGDEEGERPVRIILKCSVRGGKKVREGGYKKEITTTLGDHLRLRTGLALFLGGNGGAEPGALNTRPDDLANYGLQPLALRPDQPLLVHGGCCAPLPVTASQNIGRCSEVPGSLPGSGGMLLACAGCDKPILDKFLLNVLDRTWHAECVRCHDCRAALADKCFSREGKLFCRNDFFRRYGTKCGGCLQGISPSDLVRKARDKVFHLNCFTCMVCRKQLSTGEELYVLDDNKFICKEDYLTGKTNSDSLLCSGSEDEDEDELKTNSHHHHGSSTPEANNNSLTSDVMTPLLNCDSKTTQDDSEDQGSLDGDPETRDSQTENKSPDDGNSGSKRRGPRTTIKAKQLEILKNAFSQTPKPTRHIREQLAKETGLPMRVIQKPTTAKTAIKGRQLEILKAAFESSPKPTRQIREQLSKDTDLPMKVIQVWFQNKRSKERRLKQLTSMGRGPFFGSSRKMRGFPMNLSPAGLDDGPPGFPYFATADGKFEFGYGGPGFHHDFFPGHHPHQGPGGPMPFPGPGGPMDGSMPMHGGDFGGMTPESPPGFLPAPPPGPEQQQQQQLMSQRSSPEFIRTQILGGNNGFSDPPTSQNEGLVW